jgi:hypothetical protein
MRSFPSPPPPESIEATGLSPALVEELVLKHLLGLGEFKLADVAARVKLPVSLIEGVLDEHRREQLIEVKGSASYAKTSYLFRLTDAGRKKGQELLRLCRYAGPAPVALDKYREMVKRQMLGGRVGGDEALRTALSGLVVDEEIIRRLGPAISSGQAIYLNGPAGNGKSSIAEAVGRALPDAILVPHAVAVGGEIISVFDPVCHEALQEPAEAQECDARWVRSRRPVVNAGGELSLKMLDLTFSQLSGYYEASLQMKANNGLFIIDDFGRQQSDPTTILNRWVVPLERRIDHMTLESGMRFLIPFDVLVIFSSDLQPEELVHEAFQRRLRYKIRIERPSSGNYREIFQRVCRARGVDFCPDAFRYLEEEWYGARGIERSACHPRDLIDHVVTCARYFSRPVELTTETLGAACSDYFAAP